MNQILKPAIRTRTRFGDTPHTDIAIDTRYRPAGRIEYDDGDPATIVPAGHRHAGERGRLRLAHAIDRASSFRAPPASADGRASVEYDDGNPATIAAG